MEAVVAWTTAAWPTVLAVAAACAAVAGFIKMTLEIRKLQLQIVALRRELYATRLQIHTPTYDQVTRYSNFVRKVHENGRKPDRSRTKHDEQPLRDNRFGSSHPVSKNDVLEMSRALLFSAKAYLESEEPRPEPSDAYVLALTHGIAMLEEELAQVERREKAEEIVSQLDALQTVLGEIRGVRRDPEPKGETHKGNDKPRT